MTTPATLPDPEKSHRTLTSRPTPRVLTLMTVPPLNGPDEGTSDVTDTPVYDRYSNTTAPDGSDHEDPSSLTPNPTRPTDVDDGTAHSRKVSFTRSPCTVTSPKSHT